MKLTDFHALTFDCYGTLIDWEAGIQRAVKPWADRLHLDIGGDELLRLFSEFEPQVQGDHPRALYCDVLRMVFQRIADALGADLHDGDADRFAASIGRWPPFPDTKDALQRLKKRYRIIIVSNVDRASFRKTSELLSVGFDAVVTAQDVGAYKPDPRMLEAGVAAAREFHVPRERVLHTAQSLFHDHAPAKLLGLATCHIDRRAGRGGGAAREPEAPVAPDFTFTSLAEMADAVEQR